MATSGHEQNNRHYVFLPPLLVITLLLQTPPPLSAFGQGTQIQANFRMYCNRRASQRFPVHADVMRCGGLCRPKNDVRNLFSIRVNATSYFSQNIQVAITANPGGGLGNNIRGFAVVAMTDEEAVVGSFSEQPEEALIASCDPLMEGDTAFHAQASSHRRSLTLTWEPESRNYGRVRFRAWIVVQHYDIYVIDSDYLDNEISGSRQYDVQDNFYTFILRVFNISRSAATILTPHPQQHQQQHDSGPDSSPHTPASHDNSNNSHVTGSQRDDEGGASVRGAVDLHLDSDIEGQSSSGTSQRTAVPPPASSPSFGDGGGSSAGPSEGGALFLGTGIRGSSPRGAADSLSPTADFGGSSVFIRRTSQSIADIIGRFTTQAPPTGRVLANIAEGRDSGASVSTATVLVRSGGSVNSSSSRIHSGSTSERSDSINSKGRKGGVSSSDLDRGSSDEGDSSNSRSTIQVMVTLASGRSAQLTLPSLTSFEQAFERRLMTMGYDVNADDPFHQLKEEVPTFRNLFPQPLPPSSSALGAFPTPSTGNPFFQAFGSSSPARPTSSLPPTSRFSPTTRITQTFSDLLPAIRSQAGFGTQGPTPSSWNQFGGSLGGQFGPAGIQTTTGRFPTSSDFMRRPGISNAIAGIQTGFGTSSRGVPLPTNINAFQPVGANAGPGLAGARFPQRINDGSPLGFLSSPNSFPNFNANPASSGRNVGGLFSASQGVPFAAFPSVNSPSTVTNTDFSGTNSRSGFPDTSSLFGRFPSSTRTNPLTPGLGQGRNPGSGGFTSSGFGQQNPEFGFPQIPNSGNTFRGQPGFLSGRENWGSNFFAGLGQGNSLFGQQNSDWSRVLPQQFRGPFSASGTLGNSLASFAGQQPGGNFFSSMGNFGFPSSSGFTSRFSGNFPASSASLLGRMSNQFSSFQNPAQTQTDSTQNQWLGFNPLTSNSMPTAVGGMGGSFNINPLSTAWFGAGSRPQNAGFLASPSFRNRFPAAQLSIG